MVHGSSVLIHSEGCYCSCTFFTSKYLLFEPHKLKDKPSFCEGKEGRGKSKDPYFFLLSPLALKMWLPLLNLK